MSKVVEKGERVIRYSYGICKLISETREDQGSSLDMKESPFAVKNRYLY